MTCPFSDGSQYSPVRRGSGLLPIERRTVLIVFTFLLFAPGLVSLLLALTEGTQRSLPGGETA